MAVISTGAARRALADYDRALEAAPLADQSRRAYRSRVAGYLDWLSGDLVGGSDLRGDPLADPAARDFAVAEYRSWMRSARGALPSTVNATLTALDHFYARVGGGGGEGGLGGGLGAARADRADGPASASSGRVLDERQQRRFLEALEGTESARDRGVAAALFHTGIGVSELVALDVPDVRLRARRPLAVVRAARSAAVRPGPARTVPLLGTSVRALRAWVRERAGWPGAGERAALFLNRRGGRLTARSVDDLVTRIGRAAGVADHRVTPQVLRNTFAHRLVAEGVELAVLAELLGHRRLATTRRYVDALVRGAGAAPR